MRKLFTIARQEYIRNLRKRSFLFTAFIMPLFIVGLMFVSVALSTSAADGGPIGYVDEAGIVIAQWEHFHAFETTDAAHSAVEAGDIDLYIVIPEAFWEQGTIDVFTARSLNNTTQREIRNFVRTQVAEQADGEIAWRLNDPFNMMYRVLGSPFAEFGSEGIIVILIMPYVIGMLFIFATLTTSQFLMQGVVEEKENRIMEILATSVTPEQLIFGKLIGLGGLGLTQVAAWAVLGVIGINLIADETIRSLLTLPPSFLLLVAVYLVLGYFFYASIMAGVGAAVTSQQEGQTVAGLLSFGGVIPMVIAFLFIIDPNGTVPVVLSLIPFTAPIAVISRLPVAAIPAWQIVASLAILLVSTIFISWLSARVFRLGMLMYGKRLGLRDIWRALQTRRKQPITSGGVDHE